MAVSKWMKRLFRLWGLYARMDAAWLMRDTKVCVMALIADWIATIAGTSTIFLLAWRFDGAAGMNKYEVLLMLAYGMMVSGLIQLFGCFNVICISRRIGRGQMDHMLIQPLPLPVQMMTEGFIPVSGSASLLSGFALVLVSTRLLGIALTLNFWLSLLFLLVCSFAILIALAFIVGSNAFYAPVTGEELSSAVLDLSADIAGYPLAILPEPLRWAMVTLLPIGIRAWFPAQVLAGHTPLGLGLLWPAVPAIILSIVAEKIFKKGLKHYVQNGSNRYRDMGHRR